MKRLLLSLIALAWLAASPAQAAIAIVQSAGGAEFGGGGIAGYAIGATNTGFSGNPATYNVGTGNLVVSICFNYVPDGNTITGSSDSGSNGYSTAIASANFTPSNVVLFSGYNSNTAPFTAGNVTCHASASLNHLGGIEAEFSGLLTSGAFDSGTVNSAQTGSTVTPSITTTAPTAVANEVLIGCVLNGTGVSALSSEAASWTSIPNGDTIAISGAIAVHCAYRIVSSTGSYTYNPTFTGSAAVWTAMIESFEATGGGASTTYGGLTTTGAGP